MYRPTIVSDDAREEVAEDKVMADDGLVTDSTQESKKEHDRGRSTKMYT